ncbi:hypothetical protein [Nannocystis sp. SCPEA4]|uniref:hypothetical protein n=1 Tax=Nannocystis sp. SCPEA4 TaxID=2996787 RepID=UPI00226E6A08|nr:hypothetical protein [Nannocystis sp. SCPEA4]MCY1060172.1 hypothetical protein [Nannocystis sp. SCPEA4]
MPTVRARWLVCLLLTACPPEREETTDTAGETAAPESFPCGANGGTCQADELCIVGGPHNCSTCVPLPAACDGDDSCDCIPPGTDAQWGSFACEDAGTCAADDGGRVLTCESIAWDCG